MDNKKYVAREAPEAKEPVYNPGLSPYNSAAQGCFCMGGLAAFMIGTAAVITTVGTQCHEKGLADEKYESMKAEWQSLPGELQDRKILSHDMVESIETAAKDPAHPLHDLYSRMFSEHQRAVEATPERIAKWYRQHGVEVTADQIRKGFDGIPPVDRDGSSKLYEQGPFGPFSRLEISHASFDHHQNVLKAKWGSDDYKWFKERHDAETKAKMRR